MLGGRPILGVATRHQAARSRVNVCVAVKTKLAATSNVRQATIAAAWDSGGSGVAPTISLSRRLER